MGKDAEAHAEEDKRKRAIAEQRNQADSMCWQLEKLIKEQESKLSQADKDAVTRAIEKTREAAKSDDVERIKSAVHELEQASHALSKTLYEKAGAQAGAGTGPQPGPGAGPQPGPGPQPTGGDDDAIDAEFEVK
jgi:molecular chaperone DnaK